MRRPLTLLTIAATALAAAGCGGDGGGGGTDAEVRKAVEDYLTALAAGNGRRACDQLTPGAQKEAVEIVTAAFADSGDIDCEQAIEELSRDAGQDTKRTILNPEVSEVEVDGDTATARVKGLSEPARLSRVGDGWKVSRNVTG
jgi:hypothetical protein